MVSSLTVILGVFGVSGGKFCYGISSPIWSLGGGNSTIEGEHIPYSIVSPLGSFTIIFVPGGKFTIWYLFRGEGF